MSKIVQAVNSMITHSNKIGNVINGDEEIFFLYKNYKWSIAKRDDGHYLWFYPNAGNLEALAQSGPHDWSQIDMVVYKDSDIGTKEAKASFADLYSLVKEKVYGVDIVLDDIISDDEW